MQKFNVIKDEQLSSVEEMFDIISNQLINRNSNWAFRGHNNAEWKLESTLMRYIDCIEKIPHNLNRQRDTITRLASTRIYNSFKDNLIVNNDIPQEKVDSLDLWQYGQHFGLPTPLLDWTLSPFVALFFSLGDFEYCKRSKNSKYCIYVLDLDLIKHLNEEIIGKIRPKYKDRFKPESFLNEQFPTLDIISQLNEYNRRLSFQQGLFTKLDFYRSIEVWLDRITKELHFDKTNSYVLKKYSFPMSEKDRLIMLDKLDKMNINNRTLFPDVFGSVQDAIESTTRSFTSPSIKNYSFKSSKLDEINQL